MDLRPRPRKPFSGFTDAEIEKMEKELKQSGEQVCDQEFCKKLAQAFSHSKGRAGKQIVKWTEVQTWFRNRQRSCLSKDNSAEAKRKLPDVTEECALDKAITFHMPEGQKVPDLSDLEFEARSSTDGAWYDVDTFISHRYLSSGEPEVLVRFAGFGSEEDEWINVRKSVRERSVPLESSECNKVRVGDPVLCFQERKDQARYVEARVIEIQKKFHDIRGCRCLFVIQYDHDNTEEIVHLRRLCFRPSVLGRLCQI
ncbi:PREDICTED: protein SAWADEE HOMEODOMAIN HOMOLOG 2-like [Nicotiana attenuata]|uniref:Protein sawadee homeodomain -like 2 n=1 Tax=Nicotiana attenuata TaxID=49451 RepID=A0A1J6JWW4_NICAT|nr:PREDICTED: protein SAWADEE HOMEODOMAIN HOMOLOG 2-like [Nicotiana attenuata]OIT21622.1 protein sawadee homeodomain -like 2 [Nicotiana attenuata]